jgi:hypothetical protein
VVVAAPPGYIDPAVSTALNIADPPVLPTAQHTGKLRRRDAAYPLAQLARLYTQILETGMHVLSLQPPVPMDAHAQLALAARSVVPRGTSTTARQSPQVVIYETAAIGYGFAWLVQQAAEAARHGLGLEPILLLLKRVQEEMTALYITRWPGPIAASQPRRHPARRLQIGHEQCWYLDQLQQRFVCQAHGRHLSRTLFQSGGMLEAIKTPPFVCATNERLLGNVVQSWNSVHTTPLHTLTAREHLSTLFPRGCVELTLLPEQTVIQQIAQELLREPEPATLRSAGVRQRAGF